jgi:hypothetical protein
MNKVVGAMLQLRHCRQQPLWTLLKADNAPAILAILQQTLGGEVRQLSTGTLQERVHRHLEDLRAQGEDLPLSSKEYVASWLKQGWLLRKLPEGVQEEVYELSADAQGAIRTASAFLKPRTAATESRLTAVISQVKRLAEETDTNQVSRLDALLREKRRIEEQIQDVMAGRISVLPDDSAVERFQEVLALIADLPSDFSRYKEAWALMDRKLRRSLLEGDDSRAQVLGQFFNAVDELAETEEGKTFHGFWRLVMDASQRTVLEEAIADILERGFASRLIREDKRLMRHLPERLMEGASSVHAEFMSSARSLNAFVKSREYLEHRRLRSLIRDANAAALKAKDVLRPSTPIHEELILTQIDVGSVSQHQLHDPKDALPMADMQLSESSTMSLSDVTAMILGSEIDLRVLRENILDALETRPQVSVPELMELYPVNQGLGTLMGYLSLGAKHGLQIDASDTVRWSDQTGHAHSAKVVAIYFTHESRNALAE